MADAVMLTRCLLHGATEPLQVLAQPCAALVLGSEREERRPRLQRPQGEGEDIAALHGARRRGDHRTGKGFRRNIL